MLEQEINTNACLTVKLQILTRDIEFKFMKQMLGKLFENFQST